MQAMELARAGEPARAEVARIVERCLERGVLVITAGAGGNVIRLLPPLTIQPEQLARALDVLGEEVLAAARTVQAVGS